MCVKWSSACIPQQRRERLPRAPEPLPTGIAGLDDLLGGGLPRGGIVEIWGLPSSGRTGLLFSILAQATSRGETAAYIDSFLGMDPCFARKAGMDLSRLLWVQCRSSLGKAFQAADIVARGGGIGVLALDLERPDGQMEKDLKRIPFSTWYRLRRMVEGTSKTILVLCREPVVGSAAQISIALQSLKRRWGSLPGSVSRLEGFLSEARLHRGKRQGYVTLHCSL